MELSNCFCGWQKKTETEQQPTQNRSQIRFCAKQRDNLGKDENPMDQIKIVVYSFENSFT